MATVLQSSWSHAVLLGCDAGGLWSLWFSSSPYGEAGSTPPKVSDEFGVMDVMGGLGGDASLCYSLTRAASESDVS